jgi:glycosyltransferase involved in cell wall biosynthesis
VRILELGKFYPPHHGGIETLLRSWCEGFVRHGAGVECVVANDAARTVHETVNSVRVHRLASFGLAMSTSLCPSYPGSTGRYPADLWHAHFPNPLADLACMRGDRSVPLVLTWHSEVVRQAGWMLLYRPLLRRLLERATRIVVATPPQLEYSAWLGPYRGKCEVIPFGIDLARFALGAGQEGQVAELRQRAGGRPILLTIGRLVGYKGHRYLIEAARGLDAALWLVGTGPLRSALSAQAQAMGLGDRVRFWGALGDGQLPVLMHACDVFVLPSITPNEAFGLVQLEAMACAKPVVSCALRSGVPFVNRDGETGLVVQPADAGALRVALGRLLGDAVLRQRLGAAGRVRVHGEFADDMMVRRYWELIGRLVAGGPGS